MSTDEEIEKERWGESQTVGYKRRIVALFAYMRYAHM